MQFLCLSKEKKKQDDPPENKVVSWKKRQKIDTFSDIFSPIKCVGLYCLFLVVLKAIFWRSKKNLSLRGDGSNVFVLV